MRDFFVCKNFAISNKKNPKKLHKNNLGFY